MADITKAITFVLRQEDSRLSGQITNVPGDAGGLTRFGIALRFHPELVAGGFFSTLDNNDAFTLAIATYRKFYAGPLYLQTIDDQRIANALLSFSVISGCVAAVKTLQRCLGWNTPDGVIGPVTLNAINAADPGTLLGSFIAAQIVFFQGLGESHPVDTKFVQGWVNRANAARNA
jgi:lysozyme family protein